MFDFIYYTVSFILWCWHQVFGFLFGPANFIGWALSIILLVFTLRLVLLKPAIAQIRSMRKMQKFAPEMKRIREKYANDRTRQTQELQKLQKEHGVNPLGGCLPLVLQIPVFLGLNHVLRSFRAGTTEVYFFKENDVHNYLNAKLFDAHLSDAILGIGKLGGTPGWHWGVAPVAIPLMIAAAVATHFTARLSVQRQAAMGTPQTSQTTMMNNLTLYLFPLGVLVFGGSFPVGLLLYWLSNNGWTLGQQHFVFVRMDREELVAKEKAQEAQKALAPRPGQKPVQKKRGAAAQSVEDAVPDVVEDAVPVQEAVPPKTRNTKPAPGAKPVRANDPRRPVKPTVPNPNAGKATPSRSNGATKKASPGKSTAGKSTAGKSTAGKSTAGNSAAGSGTANNRARTNGAAKQDGTGQPSSEIPGLISDRSRRKKQNRKRG